MFSEILAHIRTNMSISHIYVFQMMVNIIKRRISDTYFMPVLVRVGSKTNKVFVIEQYQGRWQKNSRGEGE